MTSRIRSTPLWTAMITLLMHAEHIRYGIGVDTSSFHSCESGDISLQRHLKSPISIFFTLRLLYSVLPASVANELRHRRPVPAKKFEKVTLMFSGIAGFAVFCKKNSTDPLKIVSLLNELYTKFDDVETRYPDVYKVETVGDKYMAVSGLPESCANHARWIAKMALDMKDVSRGIIMGDEPIVVSVGIHSGEVVTGVVGHRMPRYCLFGNTVNISSRTETTGIKGKINVSQYAHAFLQDEDNFDKSFHFEHRGPVAMKGKKEPMQCYILTRNPEE